MEICRNNLKDQRGVTMLELLVAIAIFGLLAFLIAPSFALLRKNVALGNAGQELQSALRLAQNRAFVAQGGAGASHGIQLESDRYIILGGSQPQTIYLPHGVTVSGGAGQTITFTRLTGLPDSAQDVVLAAGSDSKMVRVDASGLISLP